MRRLLVVLALAAAAPAAAQDSMRVEIRESQLRLEQIRRERERLQSEMSELSAQASDVAGQLQNIERQRLASADLLREIEFQTAALSTTIQNTTAELIRTQDRLRERRVILQERLRSIYKRGKLHTVRVLLSADNFGDLLNRYKYLQLAALRDRRLVSDIERLEGDLVRQDRQLKHALGDLERIRAEKVAELAQYEQLETQHSRTLQNVRARARQAAGRLEQLARDEARIANLVAELERRRLEAERRRTARGGMPEPAATISTADLGALPWPVDGEVIYRFGPERRPSGVVLRWNGIGIKAPVGTPVRAVEAGTVMMAGTSEGYGLSVIVSHGGGYYTLYLYLGSVAVREGQEITAGQNIGTVGGERTPEGPHVEFQVRAPLRGGVPEAVDPLGWLQSRRAG